MADKSQIETLGKGVRAWNKWRVENPAIIPNLERANLEGVRLHGADLRYANLRGADFTKSEGISGANFGGADLTNATIPSDFSHTNQIASVQDTVKYAQTVFVTLLAACAYTWLTIATTSDARLLTNSKSTPLPVIQTDISIAAFYLVAPFGLVCIYIYFHIYLQRLWERLVELPAVFPDGRTVEKKISSWLLTGLAWSRFSRPPLARLQWFISVLLAWLLPLSTLFLVWVRYLLKHSAFGTSAHLCLLLIATGFGLFSYLLSRTTIQGRIFSYGKCIRDCCLVAGIITVALSIISYGAFFGVVQYFTLILEKKPGELSSENIAGQTPVSGTIQKWVPRVLWYFNQRPFADLSEATLSSKPPNWDGENIRPVEGAQLKHANLRYANAAAGFIVNGDLEWANLEWSNLKGADLRGAKLDNANLSNAFLIDSLFQGATLKGATLNHSSILRSKFNNADLTGANLASARLHETNFQNAKLLGANLRQAEFQPANFGWIEFSGAGARSSDVIVAALSGANLNGTDLEIAHLEGANLKSVIGLTQEQINRACVDEKTELPDGLVKPPPCPADIDTKVLRDNYPR